MYLRNVCENLIIENAIIDDRSMNFDNFLFYFDKKSLRAIYIRIYYSINYFLLDKKRLLL